MFLSHLVWTFLVLSSVPKRYFSHSPLLSERRLFLLQIFDQWRLFHGRIFPSLKKRKKQLKPKLDLNFPSISSMKSQVNHCCWMFWVNDDLLKLQHPPSYLNSNVLVWIHTWQKSTHSSAEGALRSPSSSVVWHHFSLCIFPSLGSVTRNQNKQKWIQFSVFFRFTSVEHLSVTCCVCWCRCSRRRTSCCWRVCTQFMHFHRSALMFPARGLS